MTQIYRMTVAPGLTRSMAASVMMLASLGAGAASAQAENIVLVHGMNMDGSSWRPVYEILQAEGYTVSIVQQPLTGLDDDVRATRQILEQQDGPVVLVGHSYGGAVITEAGRHPNVAALVYLAAFQPDIGETLESLHAEFPPLMDPAWVTVNEEGFFTIAEDGYSVDVAPDLPAAEAAFLFAAQTPTTVELLAAQIGEPAWADTPSHAVVASDDRVISPDLQRWMYARGGSQITEIAAGHMVYMSHPDAVAEIIMQAAERVE